MSNLAAIFDDLIRVETVVWNAMDARLRAELDVPLAHVEPMQVMSRRVNCRVNDIAEALAITVGGASKLVDRIESNGHCRRRPNPRDGRSSLIELTAAGEQLLSRAMSVFDQELRARFGGALSAQSLQQLAAALAKLRRAYVDGMRSSDACSLV